MSVGPEDLVLVYLRRLDTKVDRMVDVLHDHGRRLTSLEVAVGNLVAGEMNHYANTALRIDGLDTRLDRIERRLELSPA